MGEINKGVIALIGVLALAAASFLWYSKMYKPAVLARTTAQTTLDSAEQDQQKAKAELAAASANLDAESKKAVAPKDAVVKTAIARTAIPPDGNIGDASVVIEELAQKSGAQIVLDLDTSQAQQQQVTANSAGAKPLDIEIEGAGSYAEMVAFMDLVESTVYDKGGKAFVNGRLFNVVQFKVGPPEDSDLQKTSDSGGDGFSTFGTEGDTQSSGSGSGLTFKPGDVKFTLTIRMYTSEAAKAGEVGATTPDTAAQGTGADQATPGGTDATATGGDAPAGTDGAPAPVDAAAGTAPAATDPATASTQGA